VEERKGLNNREALIRMEEKTRASVLTSVPVIGALTGNEEYKGNK
jgi:hypothetical protein